MTGAAKYLKAETIYAKRLKRRLEPEYRGQIVAIDVASGDYFLGETEVEAYDKASAKYPSKTFCFLRVGDIATHVIGVT